MLAIVLHTTVLGTANFKPDISPLPTPQVKICGHGTSTPQTIIRPWH